MARNADKRRSDHLRSWYLPLLCLLLCALSPFQFAHADEAEKRLVQVGLRLLPAVIAADSSLDTMPAGTGITVVMIYIDDKPYAKHLAERLERLGSIKGQRLRIEVESVQQLTSRQDPPQALFLSQRLDNDLGRVIEYSRRNNVISFSPFRGDVEAGILAGIAVSERILPYINLQTLSGLSLELKPFFLKVAETYAP
jgi:hypothetical protein